MNEDTYYFYKHSKLYKYILNDIIMFSFNNSINQSEDRDYDKYGRYIHDVDEHNNCYYEEKLYGNYDEWEDYWDSIYG